MPTEDRRERRTGDRDVARAHGLLQRRFRRLRDCWDEDVEQDTNRLADEAVAALERLGARAALIEQRAYRQTTGATRAPAIPTTKEIP
ncbi:MULTISPECIES: hypothetical protein [Pseudonocardia]|uniref:Uncharacterized protein n=2 Tax=Pseudonocardia TaxID=1847 RepID=A0A1Y2N0M7_PSEAH|nr:MULTISPECIES: hypothetical protein [Pseudonocardia]OSY41024.1 hypothetical protein BG845_02366 [Pseudonocardia autotrophica]TDN73849.1 hypothetical protein C8E95_2956 [Pseudonocardia autotrophica]